MSQAPVRVWFWTSHACVRDSLFNLTQSSKLRLHCVPSQLQRFGMICTHTAGGKHHTQDLDTQPRWHEEEMLMLGYLRETGLSGRTGMKLTSYSCSSCSSICRNTQRVTHTVTHTHRYTPTLTRHYRPHLSGFLTWSRIQESGDQVIKFCRERNTTTPVVSFSLA